MHKALDNERSKEAKPKTKSNKSSIQSFLRKQESYAIINPKNANTENTCLKMTESKEDLGSKNVEEIDNLKCPADYDPEVWNNLPIELKQELIASNEPSTSSKVESSEKDTIANNKDNLINNNSTDKETDENAISDTEECPEGVDQQVFEQLPKEIRSELSKSMSKNTPSTKNQPKPHGSISKAYKHNKGNKKDTGAKSHSILSYFSRQK